MNDFLKSVRVLVIVICVALFAVGIIWNLFYGTLPKESVSQPTMGDMAADTAVWEAQYTTEKQANLQKTDLDTTGKEQTENGPADKQSTTGQTTEKEPVQKQLEEQPADKQDADKEQTTTQIADHDAAEVGLFPAKQEPNPQEEQTETLANQLAALRMERDSSWQQLKDGLEGLQFAEKQECLKRYEELQYKEQRLELLLKAKGLTDCLVLLEEQQANIIVGGADAAAQYQKIYDLVQRNTSYGPEQIVIVPLAE